MSLPDSSPDETPDVPAENPEGKYYLAGESDARTGFIADLHSLADYLAANPEVPVPRYGCSILVVASGTDEEKVSQVDAVSRLLGQRPADDRETGGHYEVVRSFGSIHYQFFGVPAAQRARHQAWRSYANSVEPEEPAAPTRLAAEAFPAHEASAVSPAQASDGHRPAGITPRTRRGTTP